MQQVAPRRKDEAALAVAKLHGLNESLIVQVVEGIARKIQVVFRHDPKGADGGKRPAAFPVQLVHSVPIDDQFALVSARQVEIPHQRVPRIAVAPVARIVHAQPLVGSIPRLVFARIIPSGVRHRSLPALLFALSVKTPWQ
jgi:hypothetical protein